MDDKFDLDLFKTHLSEKISRYNDLISDLDEDSDIDMDKRSIYSGKIQLVEDLLDDIELGRFNKEE